ncbi:MAG: hypothetical protein PHW24_01220 [Candidatus Moranbacteria bacterium]|nr:hypothetical protein [Candidatus Moranbacteria bacterium]
MNRKIVSEFAVGAILLVAIVVGGIFWLKSAREIAALNNVSRQNVQPVKNNVVANQPEIKAEEAAVENDVCKPHYYEGKARISSWIVSEGEDGIVVAIKKDEISKLPVGDVQAVGNKGDFTVKLIDPTDEVKTKIKASSPQKPATITLQGYAELCQRPPLVSIQPATEAFKKRS